MQYVETWIRLHRPMVVTATMLLVASCARPRAVGEAASVQSMAGLAPGWNRIDGGPTTICSRGSPYAFFVQPGDPRRLMVYFQGGGACWDAKTCDLNPRNEYFKPAIGQREGGRSAGVFDTTRRENPVRDFTKVYVPYCTGDVHLGARTTTYTVPSVNGGPERTFEIHHNGGANADAALAWTYNHVPGARTILVAGESAGSAATPFYAAVLAEHYPRARVVQLGDASNAYEDAGPSVATWGLFARLRAQKAFRDLDSSTFNYLSFFQLAATSSPRITFAVVNSVEDSVQAFFVRSLNANSPSVPALLARHARDLERTVPRFHSYTYPGFMHTIISRAQFYTMTVDGVRLRDWLAGLLEGSPTAASIGDELLRR